MKFGLREYLAQMDDSREMWDIWSWNQKQFNLGIVIYT